MSPFLWDAGCHVFKWLASRSRSGGTPLVSPHSATNSRLSVWQCFSQSHTVTKIDWKMWWFWLNFLYTTDKTVSSNFCPSAVYIFILQIYPDTASHTILTTTAYFVIFHGLHILNFRQPCHWIMAVSSDSALHCKRIQISVENIDTQAVYWIASLHVLFPSLFFNQSCPVYCFLPFPVLVWLSLVKTKGQITIIYAEELGDRQKFQFHDRLTSEHVSAYTCNTKYCCLW
jgi:hypothetical protein